MDCRDLIEMWKYHLDKHLNDADDKGRKDKDSGNTVEVKNEAFHSLPLYSST